MADDLLKLLWKKRRDEWQWWKDINLYYWSNAGYGYEKNINSVKLKALETLCNLDELNEFEIITGISIDHDLDDEQQRYTTLINEKFKKYGIFPYHIEYWIKLEIKKYAPEAKNLSLTKQ